MHSQQYGLCRLMDKIGAATTAGDIAWQTSVFGAGSYVARWHGWHMEASWLKDETYLKMFKNGKSITLPRRIMDCLHKVILAQVDPDCDKKQRKATRKARRVSKLREREEKRILEEILGLS